MLQIKRGTTEVEKQGCVFEGHERIEMNLVGNISRSSDESRSPTQESSSSSSEGGGSDGEVETAQIRPD